MSSKLSRMPNISIPRSRFKQDFNHATTLLHGKVCPIDSFFVIPGDEYKVDLASLIRMSTPIVPFFGNIKMYVGAFFVPMRLLWNDWEKFIGDPSNHDKVQSIVPVGLDAVQLPYYGTFIADDALYDDIGDEDYSKFVDTVSVRNGKPLFSVGSTFDDYGDIYINPLKELAYYTIWNDHFRPSNLINPCVLNKAQNNDIDVLGIDYKGDNIVYYSPTLPCCKQYDYFTACTLSPQFGDSVVLPLGSFAPLVVGDEAATPFISLNASSPETVYDVNGSDDELSLETSAAGLGKKTSFTALKPASGSYTDLGLNPKALKVDLSTATAATINTIRYAFQVQKYLERSNYGSKYFEILNAHYGTTNPDSRMQRAERLGVHSFYINVNQVLSTADYSASDSNKVGQVGAVSVTGDRTQLCHYAFDEFGVFMVLVWTKHDRSYSGGILREDTYSKRLDFYSPEFANIGDMSVLERELHIFDGSDAFPGNNVFGYQEAWAELRYRRDRTSGLLNVANASQATVWMTNGASIMDYWTLDDSFEAEDIALNADFLFENRDSISRVLTTGADGPDYICDFHFNYVKTAELPLYSIPGLIDHFGAL